MLFRLNIPTPMSVSMSETVSFCCPNSCESQGARFNDMQLVLWVIEGERITFNSVNVKGKKDYLRNSRNPGPLFSSVAEQSLDVFKNSIFLDPPLLLSHSPNLSVLL